MLHSIIQYFQTLDQHPVLRLVLLVASMMLLWVLEGAVPLITMSYKKNKWRHASINFTFTLVHLLIHTGFAVFIVLLSGACRRNGFGLVNWLHTNVWLTIVISFLALDFCGGWLVHMVQHKTYFLWRFHVIHHSDNNVDVTTGLRHHPIESVLRGVFFLLGVLISGAPMYAVMIFQTILVVSTQFVHANIRLPRWIDHGLSYILVSPDMHKVHHHWKQPFTDSNYGAVLSVWDRMLGTYMHLDASEIQYGLDRYYPNEQDENLKLLITKPFGKM